MAEKQSAEQTVSNSGGENKTSGVFGRDLNTTIGGFDLAGMLSSIGAATSSSTSGAVTVGDRIVGGTRSSRQLGLVKVMVMIAGAAILFKIFKKR